MANKKISAEADGSAPLSTDLMRVARSGANYRLSWSQVFAAIPGSTLTSDVADANRGYIVLRDPTTADLLLHPSDGGSVQRNVRVTAGGLTLDGGQIKFPASQNASSDPNTLDDYEEGTFSLSNGGTSTVSSQGNYYTKIGREVSCHFDYTINTIGTGNSGTLSGLPFTSFNVTQSNGVISFYSNLTIASTWIGCYINGGSTGLNLSGNSAITANTSGSPYGVMGNSTRIVGGILYKV